MKLDANMKLVGRDVSAVPNGAHHGRTLDANLYFAEHCQAKGNRNAQALSSTSTCTPSRLRLIDCPVRPGEDVGPPLNS